jgi:hypothetical protein
MSTKLIPKDQKVYKWKLPEDKDDNDACVFHLKIRTNRERIKSGLLQSTKLIQNDEDFANMWYGENIVKIENADGKDLIERKEIVDFCLDRLTEAQGNFLQLAIQDFGDYLEKGLIKNLESPLVSSIKTKNIIV